MVFSTRSLRHTDQRQTLWQPYARALGAAVHNWTGTWSARARHVSRHMSRGRSAVTPGSCREMGVQSGTDARDQAF
jgi:hypothetical protein